MKKVRISRRQFVKLGALGGGGLALGFFSPTLLRAAQIPAPPCDFFQPSPLLRIGTDNSITIFVAKQESGQGVNVSLPMILAEELEVDFNKIITETAPYGTLAPGAHDTGGSQSVTGDWDALRKAGAAAKAMLVSAAARRWQTQEGLCRAENGEIVHAVTGNSLSYGQLACEAAALPVPESVTLKNIKDFRIVGKEQRKKNLKDMLSGKAQYGIDLRLPGMRYAAVERSPVLGGKVVSVDATDALAIPGVVQVVQYEGTGAPMHMRAGVAVIADSAWTAMKARKLLKIKWDEGNRNTDSTEALFKTFARKAKSAPLKTFEVRGDVSKVQADKKQRLSAEYAAPFLTHATMEPLNFTAEIREGKCVLWGGLQLPDWAVDTISKTCGIEKKDLKVNLALMGGAFGRRLLCDFALEAVKIAQQTTGPVKVVWDRSDDVRFGNYRPANYHRLSAAWSAAGEVQSWEHHVLTTPIAFMTEGPEAKDPSEMLGGAGKDFWYAVPNVRTAYTPVDINLHRGWLRGVEPVVNVFALESFVDEVAAKLKKDPLDFRLSLLEGREAFEGNWGKQVEPQRLAGVLKLAAEKIGWRQPRKKNHFLGIAGHMFFCDSYAAHAIEIEMLGPKKFRLVKIVAAIDCGMVVNPDGLKNQMEGGTVFGLGQALRNEITVKNSRVEQDGFWNYELARQMDVPEIEVHAVPSEARPGGAGEVGVATVSPALCNALAAAGHRVRRLPIKNEGFTWL
jgi:isoquinoline 1-oxidoreductase subunit beta